jgi:tetratricopeptide (TPR) repeat protein
MALKRLEHGSLIILKKRKAFEMLSAKAVIENNIPYLCIMKQQFVGLLFLITAFTMPATAQSNHSLWQDSLSTLNRLIAADPNNMELHLRKAAVNIELGQWDYAADEYTLVLAKDEHNPAARFYRAYTNTQMKRYDQALFDYDELLRHLPTHFEGRLGHAYVQQKMGHQRESLDELSLMAEMFPDSAVVYAARAGVESDMKMLELALYDWERATQLDSLNAGYVRSHAELLLAMNRPLEVTAVLDEAVRRGLPRGLFHQLYARARKTIKH